MVGGRWEELDDDAWLISRTDPTGVTVELSDGRELRAAEVRRVGCECGWGNAGGCGVPFERSEDEAPAAMLLLPGYWLRLER